jgi:hypothetical protein
MTTEESKKEQIDLLTDCIIKSIQGIDFIWSEFFQLWFRKYGNPLFFLFKINLSVTNTQYAELFALLTRYGKKIGNDDCKLLFYTTEHIRNTFTDVINSLLEDYQKGENKNLFDFSRKYIDIFSSTVAMDMFFSSCAVFLPPGVTIDLERIVNDSGYLHSAGKSIFIRNLKKAKKIEFISSIDNYVNNCSFTEAIPFIVYSHEDFTPYDRESSELIDKGIEQNKIYLEKMSMGRFRLSNVINDLQKKYSTNDVLIIPEPGNFLEQHTFKKENSIWLITDRSISANTINNAGNIRYYICYDQQIKNDSPFYFFDEDKPAWKSHTTLPHSLTASLLNISRPIKKEGTICDPFGGTGTTWFEAKRMQLPCKIRCSDLSPIAELLLRDNLKFFTMTPAELQYLRDEINRCNANLKNDNQLVIDFAEKSEMNIPYDYALKQIDFLKNEQKDEDQEFDFSEGFVNELEKQSYLTRIIFYIALRAELRFQGGFQRKSLTFEGAFKKSVDRIMKQIDMFIEQKSEVQTQVDQNFVTVNGSN